MKRMDKETKFVVGIFLIFAVAVGIILLAGCDGASDAIEPLCDPGTHEVRGVCVTDKNCHDLEVCNNNKDDDCNGQVDEYPCEQLLEGPKCAPGTSEASDGRCHPDPTACAEGATFDPQMYKCVPLSILEQNMLLDKKCLAEGGKKVSCYFDNDEDGWGTKFAGTHCSGMCQPFGMVQKSGDCNDKDINIHPGTTELCDGLDNNCDGQVDEGCLGSPCKNDSECPSNLQCSTPTLTTDGKPGGVCAVFCKTDADCSTGSHCFNTWSNGYTGELRFSCLPAK